MKFSIAVSALLAGFAVAAPLQAEQGNAKRVVITNRLLGGGIKIGASDQEIPGVKEVIGANGTLVSSFPFLFTDCVFCMWTNFCCNCRSNC